MNTYLKTIIAMFGMLVTLVIVAAIAAFFVKWGWNATMPDLFGLKSITALQGFWLSLLAGTFFKSSK